jgi:gamma-glutamyltranspeptidase/glutathione hydrolase
MNVTDHVLCYIGGEVPHLNYDNQRRQVKSLSGMGSAPLSPDAIAWYMKNGIPNHDVKMAPVPSVVDLCITLLQNYGTKSFGEIIAPTLDILDNGPTTGLRPGKEGWHPLLAHTLRRMAEEEARTTGSREARLQAASDRFYGRLLKGNDIAEEMEAFYIREGGFLRRADLAAHKTRIEEPLSTTYRGYTVYKCDTWTQGPSLLQMLRLLEGFDLKAMGNLSADYIHVVIEAIKLAFADRDTYYGDPNFVSVPMAALLSKEYNALRRPLIDLHHASLEARPGDPYAMQPLKEGGLFRPGGAGTTTCVIADRWGNVVSATPSSNVYVEGGWSQAGVTFGNRLRSLNTTPGHPNCIAPGKRPRITLTPTLALKDGRPILAISVAGGDLQDQATLTLLLNHIDFGMEPAAAVTAPRFATDHHQDSFDPNPRREQAFLQAGSLTISDQVEASVRAELASRGHTVTAKSTAIATPVMLYADAESGTYYAAGDPAAGRHAAGMGE